MMESMATRRRKKTKSRADGRATRARILRSATRLFAAGGYEATSLRQIAGAADIDLATLKYHFGDKAALFAAVYEEGHNAFIAMISPHIRSFDEVESKDELRVMLRAMVVDILAFADEQLPFVRLVLYRLLEDASDVKGLDAELQVVAMQVIDRAFATLGERGIIRAVDTRAFVTMLVTTFSTWFIVNQVRPEWIGDPNPGTDEGDKRAEDFFCDVLERLLLE